MLGIIIYESVVLRMLVLSQNKKDRNCQNNVNGQIHTTRFEEHMQYIYNDI